MGEEEIAIKNILNEARDKIKLESRKGIFEEHRKLTSKDLKVPQEPEEFTKGHVIEKVLQLLEVNYETGECRFRIPGGTRKADYGPRSGSINFLVQAKPINDDLYKKSQDGAVNQIVYKFYGLTEEEIKVVEGAE